MEEKKQTNSMIISWVLVDIAFAAIIVVLVTMFLSKSKLVATEQSQEKLVNYTNVWADKISSSISTGKEYATLYARMTEEGILVPGDKSSLSWAQAITENTLFTHVFLYKAGTSVVDEQGQVRPDYPLEVFDSLPESDNAFVIRDDFGNDGSVLLVYGKVGSNSYIVFEMTLEELGKGLPASSYEDYSFLTVFMKNGAICASFPKFKDVDSEFLKGGDLIKNVSGSAQKNGSFSAFNVKFMNGVGAACSGELNGDARTIACSKIEGTNLYIAFGLREYIAAKLVSTNYANARSAIIRLLIVVIVFSVFVVSTMIFSSLKTKERGRELEDKADTDLLTELTNKAATERKIQEYISDHPEGRAMMFILDIDNFKKINDTMGHAFGDTLLRTLGKEIRTEFRMTDIIGRTGGDEFIIFMKDVTDSLIVEREANRITRFFHDFKAGGDYVKYSATASIGAAIYPDDAKSFKDLYVAADQALYRAKKRGKNQLVFYNDESAKE